MSFQKKVNKYVYKTYFRDRNFRILFRGIWTLFFDFRRRAIYIIGKTSNPGLKNLRGRVGRGVHPSPSQHTHFTLSQPQHLKCTFSNIWARAFPTKPRLKRQGIALWTHDKAMLHATCSYGLTIGGKEQGLPSLHVITSQLAIVEWSQIIERIYMILSWKK